MSYVSAKKYQKKKRQITEIIITEEGTNIALGKIFLP